MRSVSIAAVLLALAGCAGVAGGTGSDQSAPLVPQPTPSNIALAPRSPTPTPAPSAWAITEAGCCSRPWWSEDGTRVLFVDDPPGEFPLAVYAVPSDGGSAAAVQTINSAADLSAVHPDGDGALEIRLVFPLPAGAGAVRLSPGGDRVAWTQGGEAIANLDLRQRSVWVAGRGQAAGKRLAVVQGGGLVGWAGDGTGLILTGRFESEGPSGVWRLPLEGGEPVHLAEGRRPRGVELSPGGGWVAFYLAFEEDRSRNGVWVAATSGGTARALSVLASYRWAGEDRLLYIPFESASESLTLMALDPVGGGTSVGLPAPAFPGGIAGNDWLPSPSGDRIVYRSAADGRLWIVALPG